VGITWSEVTITGQSDHAGPTPMHLRRDALAAAAPIVSGVERLARECDATAVATVGRVAVEPNVINPVPGRVTFSVDFRHRDAAVLDRQVERLETLVASICAERGVEGTVNRFWTSEPTPFDPGVISAIETACRDLGVTAGQLWSG